MRNASKLLVATAAAGLVATAGSAFTDSNTGMQDDIVGYSSSDTAGVVVTNTANNLHATDKSKLADIVYTVVEDVSGSGHLAYLTITTGETAGTAILCERTFSDDSNPATDDGRITCDTNDIPVADVDEVSLAVTTV